MASCQAQQGDPTPQGGAELQCAARIRWAGQGHFEPHGVDPVLCFVGFLAVLGGLLPYCLEVAIVPVCGRAPIGCQPPKPPRSRQRGGCRRWSRIRLNRAPTGFTCISQQLIRAVRQFSRCSSRKKIPVHGLG